MGEMGIQPIRRRPPEWILPGILFLALALRISDLSMGAHFSQPDEAFSLEAALQPSFFHTIFFVARDTHPPLYFLLLRGWFKIFPPTYLFAKFLSVLLNVSNIALTYLLARIFVKRKTALLAAAVMALSPWNIYWSHLARNHQLLPPLFTLSTWTLLLWLRSDKRKFPAGYCLWTILMIQTNYLGLLILPVHAILVLIATRDWKKKWLPAGGAMIIALLSYIPLAGILWHHFRYGPMNSGFFQQVVSPFLLFFRFLYFNIFTGDLGDLWYPPPHRLSTIVIGGSIMGSIFLAGIRRIRDIGFYILLFGPIVLTLCFAWWKGATMAERYLAYAIGPFSILFAAGIVEIRSRLAGSGGNQGGDGDHMGVVGSMGVKR